RLYAASPDLGGPSQRPGGGPLREHGVQGAVGSADEGETGRSVNRWRAGDGRSSWGPPGPQLGSVTHPQRVQGAILVSHIDHLIHDHGRGQRGTRREVPRRVEQDVLARVDGVLDNWVVRLET